MRRYRVAGTNCDAEQRKQLGQGEDQREVQYRNDDRSRQTSKDVLTSLRAVQSGSVMPALKAPSRIFVLTLSETEAAEFLSVPPFFRQAVIPVARKLWLPMPALHPADETFKTSSVTVGDCTHARRRAAPGSSRPASLSTSFSSIKSAAALRSRSFSCSRSFT